MPQALKPPISMCSLIHLRQPDCMASYSLRLSFTIHAPLPYFFAITVIHGFDAW